MSDFLTYCLVYVLAVVLIFWLIIGGASFWFFCLCRRYYNPNLSSFHPQHPRNLLTHTVAHQGALHLRLCRFEFNFAMRNRFLIFFDMNDAVYKAVD